MLKILVCCGNGLGSSFACQMAIDTVLKKLGVDAKLDHAGMSETKGIIGKFDIVCAAKNFATQIDAVNPGIPTVYLTRVVDKTEIEEKLTPVLQELGYLPS